MQLPPGLEFEPSIAHMFFQLLRDHYAGHLACEPRHGSWFSTDAEELLNDHSVARVAAGLSLHPGGNQPAGFTGLSYFRLHGSPQVYYSRYSDESWLT